MQMFYTAADYVMFLHAENVSDKIEVEIYLAT